LGVLIVTAGTVAALPFRRYRAIRNELPPTAATGPTVSNLGGLRLDPIAERPASQADFPALAMPSSQWGDEPLKDREIQMPLTYDDLAVPLELPPKFGESFSATSVAQAGAGSKPLVGSGPQRMQPVAIVHSDAAGKAGTQGQSLLSGSEQAGDENSQASRAISQLISSPIVESLPEPLPASAPRERHWIRQP
jgi:hypothetical protein